MFQKSMTVGISQATQVSFGTEAIMDISEPLLTNGSFLRSTRNISGGKQAFPRDSKCEFQLARREETQCGASERVKVNS